MKVRTVEQLYDRIAEDLSWRKKELSVFHGQVRSADAHVRPALLRASVALLYAHWEGFVKQAVSLYLSYLSSQNLKYEQLRPEIAALALRNHINEFIATNQSSIHARVVRQVREDAGNRARIPSRRDDVKTHSNLSFDRLENILCSIGCDCIGYEQYRDLIDQELLASRNKIAHGEEEFIALSEWNDLRTQILKILDSIAAQILNSATNRSYLAPT